MKDSHNSPPCLSLIVFLITIFAFVPAVFGQGSDANIKQETSAVTTAPARAQVMSELKGIKVGMTADEAIQKLGKPEASDAAGMYFDLSNGEAMQLALDSSKKIITLSMIYNGKGSDAPEFTEVFGAREKPERQENGSVFKRVRYPDLGIWVAYSRIGEGDNAMTTVTIQKIRY